MHVHWQGFMSDNARVPHYETSFLDEFAAKKTWIRCPKFRAPQILLTAASGMDTPNARNDRFSVI